MLGHLHSAQIPSFPQHDLKSWGRMLPRNILDLKVTRKLDGGWEKVAFVSFPIRSDEALETFVFPSIPTSTISFPVEANGSGFAP